MAVQRSLQLSEDRSVQLRYTSVVDGDFRVIDAEPGIEQRRRSIIDAPWSWIRQVHGADVLTVSEPGQHAGSQADGLITSSVGCPIAVTTADCAPLLLASQRGIAVVHAGWRGLVAGIIERAGQLLTATAGPPVAALLGPCIGPGAYEFGRADLNLVIDRYGPSVEGATDDGATALDMPAAVAAACLAAGWPAPERPPCTSDPGYYSHRTRADHGRQTLVAWLTDAPREGFDGAMAGATTTDPSDD